MSQDLYERAKSIVAEALTRPPAERPAFLDAACGQDQALRREVDSWLAAAGQAGSFLEGQTVKHVWRYNGEVMAEVPFSVGGARWRAYSSKRVFPGAEGRWTVSVVDASGNVLNESSLGSAFAGGESAPQPPPAAVDQD